MVEIPVAFAVDLPATARLTQYVHLPVVSLFAIAMMAAGCASQPTVRFDSVPVPSTAVATLPEAPPSVARAAEPESAPKLIKATTTKKPKASGAKHSADSSLIITPNPVLTGRVTSYSAGGRFVVLNFPIGHLPAMDQRLNVYHLGVKVGEVKITGPQRDDHIVADVSAGEAQTGDEVRAR